METVIEMDIENPTRETQVSSLPTNFCQLENNIEEENLQDESSDRRRTPSGNLTSRSVQDIRRYYSPGKVQECNDMDNSSDSYTDIDSQEINREIAKKIKVRARQLASQGRRSTSMASKQNKVKKPGKIATNVKPIKVSAGSHLSGANKKQQSGVNHSTQVSIHSIPEPTPQFLQLLSDQMRNGQEQNSINSDACNTSSTVQNQDMEMNDTGNPEVMSVSTVARILKDIKEEMSDMKLKMDQMEKREPKIEVSKDIVEGCAEGIEMAVTENLKKHNESLRADVSHLKYKTQTLTDVVERLNIEIEDLKTRLDGVEIGNCKKSITINGLKTSNKKEYMIKEIQEFIEIYIGVMVNVEDCFTLGNAQPRMIVASLQTIQEKKDIMRFKSYLKDVKIDGRKIFINDYVPASTQERRRKEKDIRDINSLQQNPAQISYFKGNLTVQQEVFKPKVHVPTPRNLVDISPDELTRILATKTLCSSVIERDRSLFQAYTAEVQNFNQINDLYIKMKLIQPGARHIVCAYWLQDTGALPVYNQGTCDDSEYGAGRYILDYMVKNQLKNRVIFVARKYGGIRMGAERFSCYVQAATMAIEESTGMISLQSGEKNSETPSNTRPAKRAATSPPNPTPSQVNNNRGRRNTYKRPYRGGQTPMNRSEYRGSMSHRRSPRYNFFRGGRSAYKNGYMLDSNRREQPSTSGQNFTDSNQWDFGTSDWEDQRDRDYYRQAKNTYEF